MKKILAIILSVAMLCGVLALNTFAADTTPKVTLITNEGSPVIEGTPTYLTVRFDDFASIKGMDVTITADGATLGEITETGEGFPELTENNYTVTNTDNKHQIKIVDLTSFNTGKITFQVTAPEKDAIITVSGKYADSGKSLFDITTEPGLFEVYAKPVDVEVEIPQGETTAQITQSSAGENKFIPQGSVYKVNSNGTYTQAPKDQDGNFNVGEGYVFNSFDIPANGITTFGASNPVDNPNTVRFGSYSQKNDGTRTHGTMVFEGDWLALKNLYIKNGYSVHEIVQMFYDDFDKKFEGKSENEITFVYYNLGGGKIVNVYKFPQKKYIWKNDSGVLEYGLQISNIEDNQTYTAVAYSHDNDDKSIATVSAEVKSITKAK